MLGKIHFYLGIVIIIVFLLTGQYMHHNYDHLRNMELMNRALFRAGHLYILLFGLINVSLGIHFRISNIKLLKKIQFFASIIIFSATFLVVYGFFTELPTEQIERPLTRISLYLILLGVSIHGLVSLVKR
ncbi:MAG: Uncharacterised protein [Formosa sp. Hel1_33_131]|jgi:hypothetical protein|nr:MAG: Uncharacterised protein [Formosa sp. Hel1_33_131]|tara:strand:- start:5021 stop:5410 length:390 start_codon:yes stop_codon:yes gene_type:complete